MLLIKEPASNEMGLLRPTSGQTMEHVKATFGEPTKVYLVVGVPLITRWNYT
jgi:hypothetical protein